MNHRVAFALLGLFVGSLFAQEPQGEETARADTRKPQLRVRPIEPEEEARLRPDSTAARGPEQAPALTPAQLQARGKVSLALKSLSRGRAREALKQCQEGLKLDPDHARAHYVMALLALGDERLEQATGHLTTALSKDPGNLDYLLLLSDLHRRLGEYGAALDLLDQAEEKAADSELLMQARAEVYADDGQWQRAEELYVELLESDGDASSIQDRLLDLYDRYEQPERALRLARVMLQNRPDDRPLRMRLIHYLLTSEQEVMAVEQLEELTRKIPDELILRRMLVQLYGQEKTRDEVRRQTHLRAIHRIETRSKSPDPPASDDA